MQNLKKDSINQKLISVHYITLLNLLFLKAVPVYKSYQKCSFIETVITYLTLNQTVRNMCFGYFQFHSSNQLKV